MCGFHAQAGERGEEGQREQTPEDVEERLSQGWVSLNNAVKAMEKIDDRAKSLDQKGAQLTKLLDETSDVLQKAHFILHDINTCMKFRKNSRGEPMTTSGAQDILQQAAAAIQELVFAMCVAVWELGMNG